MKSEHTPCPQSYTVFGFRKPRKLRAPSSNWNVGVIDDIATPSTLPAFLEWLRSLAAGTGGVAVGIAGRIQDHRIVQNSPNIPFVGQTAVDLGTAVKEEMNLSCVVVNDMEAALAGELVTGALKGCRWAFMDTVSTGWGGALLLDGQIIAA